MNSSRLPSENNRLRILGIFLVMIALLFSARMFYLQIIKGSEYRAEADVSQTKSLEITAKRGEIYAKNGEQTVPLVLNERRWLLFADSQFVDDISALQTELQQEGIELTDIAKGRIIDGSRYVVVNRDISESQKQQLEQQEIKGVYFQEKQTRTYTEGNLAAQVLGFVNADDKGQYGIEELLGEELRGVNGRLKAVTDSRGVPLAFERTNIDVEPKDGQDVTLTIDVGLQQIVEDALVKNVDATGAQGATGVIMNAETGAILAMANYPTFSPADFNQVDDISLYINNTISSSIEPGSVMKVLVAATALDKGVVGTEYTYFDQDVVTLDGEVVKNAQNYGAQQRKIEDILISSLNTGSIHLLSLLGGGEVNLQARTTLYDYLTGSFGLGSKTGIDLQNEVSGQVFGPAEGFGNNIRYGNMTFGQGLSITPIQLAAAYSAIFNGGDYYQPYVVDSIGGEQVQPELLKSSILRSTTVEQLRELMRRMGERKYGDVQVSGLEISGKTGTGQIANPEGGYFEDDFTGTFAGYIKSQNQTFVAVVTIDRPNVRFAGTDAAAPLWKDVVNGIVNSGKVR